MEAFESSLGTVYSLIDSHSLICPHNALVFYLKLVPGFRACYNMPNFLVCNLLERYVL